MTIRSRFHYIPKPTQRALDLYAEEFLYWREQEMAEVFDYVESAISMLSRCRYTYAVTGKRINEIARKQLSAYSALKYAHTHLKQDWAGGCFNFAASLAYQLKCTASSPDYRDFQKVAIVLSPTPEGAKKCSVAYLNHGKMFVADTVELIEGHVKEIRAISQIPFDQFAARFGTENVLLFDVDKIDGPYVEALTSGHSNTTPEEFMKERE